MHELHIGSTGLPFVNTMGEQHTNMLLQHQVAAHDHALEMVNVISHNMRENMMQPFRFCGENKIETQRNL